MNKELEAFAYSASHDLRAPLRQIQAYAQVIAKHGRLDPQDREYFDRIRSASARMNRLINDMLDLAQVTRREVVEVAVDLSAIAGSIAGELKEREPGRRVRFEIQPGLRVKADRELLTIALRNLLENAWKFTGKHPEARIEFGATDVDGQTAYFVRDDGAGFDMRYAGKLFGAFQRLHRADEFPGTGVGLALVERVVKRHGGRIWAAAEVERGATFYFTLSMETP